MHYTSFHYTDALLVDGNPKLTGNLTILCEELFIPQPEYFRADCAAVSDATNTTIFCPCCTCCDPNNATDCDYGDELAQYVPNWQDGFDRGNHYILYNDNITRF